MRNDHIIWSALEYPIREKTTDWYWALGIMAIAGAVASYILGNILFSILILLGAFTVASYGARKPHMVEFEIDRRGIRSGTTLYPHSSLASFWIVEGVEESKILLQSGKIFMPYIIIPLGEENPEMVREVLLNYLKEEEHAEPFAQRIMDYLRF
ncbi:MAG: hypothetical protein HZB09_00660 [Candidatus Yonathbacteria bacterium]|nr:hypothetical protein [Candidatus Yonathbacteria bacterium]